VSLLSQAWGRHFLNAGSDSAMWRSAIILHLRYYRQSMTTSFHPLGKKLATIAPCLTGPDFGLPGQWQQ